MSAAKKKTAIPIVPPWLRQTVVFLFGPGRTFSAAFLVVGAFSGGFVAVWRHVQEHVENSPDYVVGVQQISITPQPEWVRTDVRAEAFRTACPPTTGTWCPRPLSSLDDGLVQRIHAAFMLHPWVAKATVTKRVGARVQVDIVYRRPVCMVEVATGAAVELLPVDAEGVWLPGDDFSPKQKESYPCLANIDRRPIQPVGHPWGDARVVDGAAIAAALLPVWQQLKLYRIQAISEPPPSPSGRETGGEGNMLPSPTGTGTTSDGNIFPSPSGRATGSEGTMLPSPAGTGTGGEGNMLPSPSGRGAGGEGGLPSTMAEAKGNQKPTYELCTRAGTRILWGPAAGGAASGEPTPEDKLARLVQYAAVHGSLDAGSAIDVRKLPPAGAPAGAAKP